MLVKEFGRKGELANQAFGAGPNRAFCKPPVISGSLLLKVKASQANRRFRAPEAAFGLCLLPRLAVAGRFD